MTVHQMPKMAETRIGRDRLERFIDGMAKNDKLRRSGWIPNDDIIDAINGFAACIRITEQRAIEVPYSEYLWAIRLYRRRRGIRRQPNYSAIPLLHVA